ncbi:MAG: 4-hydroxy-tetrahydrodipicolinate reductase [Bacteroidales bacterium]|nr:4-hydroxy-tetrahydrodipicolinate reductase [Bacteroidales bacterium]
MNIAIVGYGRMGRAIEQIALERGHQVVLKIDAKDIDSIAKSDFNNVDVAIEFSTPESAFSNINLCIDNKIPVVSGTTGWLNRIEQVVERCKNEDATFFYASNYSLGVNLFFKINENLAKIMSKFSDYSIELEETHHIKKLDAPSGTAITLAEGIIKNNQKINTWKEEESTTFDSIPIVSKREGSVPGNHKVTYESDFDKIIIEHDAKSRKGFALGAVLAAEFIADKRGYFTMNDLLEI